MSQFSFDGEFRRKPKQSLGGSSKISEQKDSMLIKAREDRERRQRERTMAKAIVVVQSTVRSYLARVRMRKLWRDKYDVDKKEHYNEEELGRQLMRLTSFYDPQKDAHRLVHMVKVVLPLIENIRKLISKMTWQIRIMRLLRICVQTLNVDGAPSAVLVSLINNMTDIPDGDATWIEWAALSWFDMIYRGKFFYEWRKFLESRIPLWEHEGSKQISDITAIWLTSLVKIFQTFNNPQSFEIVAVRRGNIKYTDAICNTVLKCFSGTFIPSIIPTMRSNKIIANIVLPNIAHVFPLRRWLQFLMDLPTRDQESQNKRNILYAVVILFKASDPVVAENCFDLFIDCVNQLLSSIDNRTAPIPDRTLSNFENDIDDEFMITPEIETYYEECTIVYLELRECLNNNFHIPRWISPFCTEKWVKLYPIISCIIRLEPKLASTHFNFLAELAYNRDFLKRIYLKMNNESPLDEISAFTWLLAHLIATLHDAEFLTHIPLEGNRLANLVNFLAEKYTTIILDDKALDAVALSGIKFIVSLLRGLHDRNTRMLMFPEDVFHSVFRKILPIDSHSLRFDEQLSDPSSIQLPPLDKKLLRVLRELPYCLSFPDRVTVWNRMINLDRGDRSHDFTRVKEYVQIRRNFIYEDAFEKLSPDNVKNMRGLVRISLVNTVGALEAGVDGGGLLREFLIEVTRAAVDPNRVFFRVDSQNRIYPNPVAKKLYPDFRKHFFFVGRLVGKTLYEQTHLELPFAAFFIQTWITGNVAGAVDYLATLDPDLHKNLLQLKEFKGDWNSMSIDFTLTLEAFGKTDVVELKKNGKDIQVDSSNIIEYIHLVADYKINREMEDECKAFRAGIRDVIPLLDIFSWREMQTLISGSDKPIDLKDWAANVNYASGFSAEHPTIILFWQVLNSFEEKDLRKLLKFVTSCSRPPLLGFKDLVPKFGIQNVGVTDRLPTASTCMNLLKLPELTSETDLREKLMYVIDAQAGFELS